MLYQLVMFSKRLDFRTYRKKMLHFKRKLAKYRRDLHTFLTVLMFVPVVVLMLLLLNSSFSNDNTSKDEFNKKIDWHDWHLIKAELTRTGLGEHGEAAFLKSYPQSTKQINDTHGYNGYLSDKIALNRSLKDLRPTECILQLYSANLPSVSVIVIFHNEHLSTLLRTCYSVWNRTPPKLLAEIILVDDASTLEDLGNDLDEHLAAHLPTIKLIRLKRRSGLIHARVVGAREARSDILVFLDSHCEAYHNWLPPLLDAMAGDYKTVVLPSIDVIADDSFEFRRQKHISGFAGRGVFDWTFKFRLIPLLPSAISHPTKPFETPVMAGGLFAIHAKFFWELGGYDEGLNTYGGEQFELSFKIWQCGGKMLESACSRVGHIYRYRPISVNLHIKYDFVSTNYKRVAEVWMDEYKEHLYNRQPVVYAGLDAGDISAQKAVRDRLQCKPFKWFMENVAFDLLEQFPLYEPSFAFGGLQNVGLSLCADTLSKEGRTPIGLFTCALNISYPHAAQTFSLTLQHEMRLRFERRCWSRMASNAVWLVPCLKNPNKHLLWKYDTANQWIINESNGFCLDIDETSNQLILARCIRNKREQMWKFGNLNRTAILSRRL